MTPRATPVRLPLLALLVAAVASCPGPGRSGSGAGVAPTGGPPDAGGPTAAATPAQCRQVAAQVLAMPPRGDETLAWQDDVRDETFIEDCASHWTASTIDCLLAAGAGDALERCDE